MAASGFCLGTLCIFWGQVPEPEGAAVTEPLNSRSEETPGASQEHPQLPLINESQAPTQQHLSKVHVRGSLGQQQLGAAAPFARVAVELSCCEGGLWQPCSTIARVRNGGGTPWGCSPCREYPGPWSCRRFGRLGAAVVLSEGVSGRSEQAASCQSF